jgi:hypothetical protein
MVTTFTYATMLSVGTGTTKTQVNAGNDVVMPAGARELVSVVPIANLLTPTAAQSMIIKIELESADALVKPVEVPAPPIGAILGATCPGLSPELTEFPIHLKLNGGERFQVFGTAQVANTVAPLASCLLKISDTYSGLPQLHWKAGTLTATGTALADVAATTFSITGAKQIDKVWSIVAPTTELASNPIAGYGYLESSDFLNSFPTRFAPAPCGPILGALGSAMIGRVTIWDYNMPVKTPCSIRDHFVLEQAPGTAGNFWNGIAYE